MDPHSQRAPEPLRSQPLGCIIQLAAVGLLILVIYFVWGKGFVQYAGIAIAAPIVTAIWYLGARLSQPTASELVARDGRPPILYLRSFALDQKLSVSPEVAAKYGNLDTARQRWEGNTPEGLLCDAFSVLGPVVAIGWLGDRIPPLGAAREYVGDDWQERVVEWIQRSALVIIQPTATRSVVWEIGAALQHIDPRRILIVFWRTSNEDYDQVRRAIAQATRLPNVQGRTERHILVRFRQDREPYFERIAAKPGSAELNLDDPLFWHPVAHQIADELGYSGDALGKRIPKTVTQG